MKNIIEKVVKNIENRVQHACTIQDTWMGFDVCDCCGYSQNWDKDRAGLSDRISRYTEDGYRICGNCLTIYVRETGNKEILDNLYNSPNKQHRVKMEAKELELEMKHAMYRYLWESNGGRVEERMQMISNQDKKLNFNLQGEAYQLKNKWVYDVFYNGKILKAQGAEQKVKWARNQAMLDVFAKAIDEGYYPYHFYLDMKIINKGAR